VAGELYLQSLEISRQLGDSVNEGTVLCNLGLLYHEQGRLEEARTTLEEALRFNTLAGHRLAEAVVGANLAPVLLELAELEAARRTALGALGLLRELGNRHVEARVLRFLSALERRRGDLVAAERLLCQAQPPLVDDGPFPAALNLCELGHLRLARGESAAETLAAAEALAEELQPAAGSELGAALDRLRRALAAFETAGTQALFRGEARESIPARLLQCLEAPASAGHDAGSQPAGAARLRPGCGPERASDPSGCEERERTPAEEVRSEK
jgi:tetratricopeptide (TPR) repeat protein